jgi:hypothetical protein
MQDIRCEKPPQNHTSPLALPAKYQKNEPNPAEKTLIFFHWTPPSLLKKSRYYSGFCKYINIKYFCYFKF